MITRRFLLQAASSAAILGIPPALAQSQPQVFARRLTQVSGRADPDGLYHYQDTSQWGIEGVDLGASTVHDGRTYIFFGDVPRVGRTDGPEEDADAIGVIDDVHVPVGAALATGRQGEDQSDVFFVGANGALYVSWVVAGGNWTVPFQITNPGVAPPGAALAVANQSTHQLDVFFIGSNGALQVVWVIDNGIWQGPHQISPERVGQPGGKLIAVNQRGDQLDVLFIGQNRRLQVAWVSGLGTWAGPISIGDPAVPYPTAGSGIAACRQGADQLDVFFVGEDGGFYVAWSTAGQPWAGPLRVSPPGVRVSVPGAGLTAFNQAADLVTSLFIDSQGRLASMFVLGGGQWQGPAPAVAQAPAARPGAQVTVFRQGNAQWDAFVPLPNGAIDVYWVGSGNWQGPFQVAPPATTVDTSWLAVVQQLSDQITLLSPGPDGQLNVNWVGNSGIWGGPVRINPDLINVRILTSGRYFLPFQAVDPDTGRPEQLGSDSTPTGAFSQGGRIYVFYVNKPRADVNAGYSALSSSDFPEGGQPFRHHFKLSSWPDPTGGRFLQVAPLLTPSGELTGLTMPGPECVVLFGHGAMSAGAPQRPACIEPKSPSGVNLAVMPILPGQGPSKTGLRFYAGGGIGGEPLRWATSEGEARSLFTTCYYWTSLSVGRIPGTGKWILLYQLAGPREVTNAHNQPMVARIANSPWELAVVPDVVVFHPDRDRGWNHFMFADNVPASGRTAPNIGHPAFPYGAYLLHKYLRWDAARKIATIMFLMSSGRPYQVQMIQSEITVG
jgi:hypothetical protein